MLILTILQAFYFIMKSLHTEGSELYSEYATTWVALFHMTLGEYEVGTTVHSLYNKQTTYQICNFYKVTFPTPRPLFPL
jgi:hypothetical protein